MPSSTAELVTLHVHLFSRSARATPTRSRMSRTGSASTSTTASSSVIAPNGPESKKWAKRPRSAATATGTTVTSTSLARTLSVRHATFRGAASTAIAAAPRRAAHSETVPRVHAEVEERRTGNDQVEQELERLRILPTTQADVDRQGCRAGQQVRRGASGGHHRAIRHRHPVVRRGRHGAGGRSVCVPAARSSSAAIASPSALRMLRRSVRAYGRGPTLHRVPAHAVRPRSPRASPAIRPYSPARVDALPEHVDPVIHLGEAAVEHVDERAGQGSDPPVRGVRCIGGRRCTHTRTFQACRRRAATLGAWCTSAGVASGIAAPR